MPSAFQPLRERAFARCFWGNGISNVGASMQMITMPFVIYQITGSRSWLGIAALMAQGPGLIATSFAGTLADRYTLRRVLVVAQAMLLCFSVTFWLLWVTGQRSLPLYLSVMVLNGMFNGVIFPLWQAFVSTIVPRELMAPAVRLSSLQFAIARVVGPFVGGFVLEHFGPGTAFATNAGSYLFVMWAVTRSPRVPAQGPGAESPVAMMRAGFRYAYAHRPIRLICATVAVVGLCGWALPQLFPAIAKEQFHMSATRVGSMGACNGLGSLTTALLLSIVGQRVRRSRTGTVGLLGWVIGIAILGSSATFGIGLVGLYVMGLGHTSWVMSSQPAVMLQVHDEYRARVMSVYMVGVTAGPPIGAVFFGSLSEFIGLQGMALAMSATLFTFFAYVVIRHGGYGFLDQDGPLPTPDPLTRSAAAEPAGERALSVP